MNKVIKDDRGLFTIETCLMYYNLGFYCEWNDGRYVTLIDKEKDLPAPQQR